MSSLSYICDYGSESETSDSEVEVKRTKLPAPDLSKVPVVQPETHVDNPEQHGGHNRIFPHVRGNWATYVYVNYTAEEELLKVIDKLEEILLQNNKLWQRCDNFHISVSKTLVLNYHIVTPFTTSLKAVSYLASFELGFSGVKIYCNEDNSRTFIALEADPISQSYLKELSQTVDDILIEYKLPTFYTEPSFHMSIFWINGNHKSNSHNIQEELCKVLKCETKTSLKTILVDKVNCKSGNKYFQYHLQ